MGEPQGRQYGQIDIDSNRYLAGPALPGRRLLAAVRWDSVQITDPGTGEIVAGYPRIYGRSPSTLQDPELAMPVLAAKPGSWGESSIRPDFPEDVRAWLDEADSKRLAQSLRSIGAACAAAGFGNAAATGLLMRLRRAKREDRLDTELRQIAKARLLIIDEFGYMPIDEEGSRLLFQVISDSYETRSVIYTTNIEFSGWGRVLGDKNMAAALIDRTVHHGRLVRFEGGSYRSEHALMTR